MKKSLFDKFRIIRHKVENTPPVDPLVERLVNAEIIIALEPSLTLKAYLFASAHMKKIPDAALVGIDMIAIWVDYKELLVWMSANPQSGFRGTSTVILPLTVSITLEHGIDKLTLRRKITASEAIAYLRPISVRESDVMQHYVNWTNFLREPESKGFPLNDPELSPAAGAHLVSLPFHRQDPDERWG